MRRPHLAALAGVLVLSGATLPGRLTAGGPSPFTERASDFPGEDRTDPFDEPFVLRSALSVEAAGEIARVESDLGELLELGFEVSADGVAGPLAIWLDPDEAGASTLKVGERSVDGRNGDWLYGFDHAALSPEGRVELVVYAARTARSAAMGRPRDHLFFGRTADTMLVANGLDLGPSALLGRPIGSWVDAPAGTAYVLLEDRYGRLREASVQTLGAIARSGVPLPPSVRSIESSEWAARVATGNDSGGF